MIYWPSFTVFLSKSVVGLICSKIGRSIHKGNDSCQCRLREWDTSSWQNHLEPAKILGLDMKVVVPAKSSSVEQKGIMRLCSRSHIVFKQTSFVPYQEVYVACHDLNCIHGWCAWEFENEIPDSKYLHFDKRLLVSACLQYMLSCWRDILNLVFARKKCLKAVKINCSLCPFLALDQILTPLQNTIWPLRLPVWLWTRRSSFSGVATDAWKTKLYLLRNMKLLVSNDGPSFQNTVGQLYWEPPIKIYFITP